jgi:hypothetical protein
MVLKICPGISTGHFNKNRLIAKSNGRGSVRPLVACCQQMPMKTKWPELISGGFYDCIGMSLALLVRPIFRPAPLAQI